jgi:hypothetical protein
MLTLGPKNELSAWLQHQVCRHGEEKERRAESRAGTPQIGRQLPVFHYHLDFLPKVPN